MAAPNKLQIGKPLREFPGEGYNALVDDYWIRRGNLGGGGRQPSAPLGSNPRVVIYVHNSTASAIDPGEVLGIDGTIFPIDDPPTGDPDQMYSAPNAKGVTPTTADHADAFVIALDVIPADEVGPAVLFGAAWAKVSFSDETHKYAKVKSGDTASLESASSGARIVYHEDIPVDEYDEPELPATLWAVVLLGGGGSSTSSIRAGQVTTEITPATGPLAEQWGSGEVELQNEDTGALEGGSISVQNDWIGTGFIVNAQVKLDMAHSPPRVLTGTCDEVSWDEPT